MYLHTFIYQKWDKNCIINEEYKYSVIPLLIVLYLSTDLFSVLNKKISITTKYTSKDYLIFGLFLPFLLFLFQLMLVFRIKLEGYKNTFEILKYIILLMNAIKVHLMFIKQKIICDLIKLVDTVWYINILLLFLTDPQINTKERKNLIVFYEVYFRYLEHYILVLSLFVIHHYNRIELETKQKLYTTVSILGKKDSLRVFTIFIFAYLFFPITNCIAYSFKYLICFFTMIPSIYCIRQFRRGNINKAYYSLILVLFINLFTYAISLYFSVPNVGDGSNMKDKF